MKHLELCGCSIRVDDDDFLSLTDMWTASGSDQDKAPEKFLKDKDTVKFIKALKAQDVYGETPVKWKKRGDIWVFRYLAYKYACWLDPGFEVEMYRLLQSHYSNNLGQRIPREELEDLKLRYIHLIKELQVILELEDLI